MQKLEDVLTGLMIIGSTLVVFAIVAVGFSLFCRNEFISLALLFAAGFFTLYTLRNIYIGFSLIFHGRYRDEMTVRDNRRYTD